MSWYFNFEMRICFIVFAIFKLFVLAILSGPAGGVVGRFLKSFITWVLGLELF